jgi:predicted adenine nucleotide alpha hydrolase (AANH) superfamily ATPase
MADNKLLLHVCCGPCAANVIDELLTDFDITLYFFNPNIYPESEYIKRKEAIKNHADTLHLNFYDEDYDYKLFTDFVKGYEDEEEGKERCKKCFELRLSKTFEKAKSLGIQTFTTTLSVSPHKKSTDIFSVANNICKDDKIIFAEKNFKKNNGFKKSMEKAKALGFYIQNYCGCSFSLR